jgi:hypothetical protein
MFMDEILELFGGPSAYFMLEEMPYKELVALRDARIKRKNKELEDEQKYREEELKAQERAAARNKIIR